MTPIEDTMSILNMALLSVILTVAHVCVFVGCPASDRRLEAESWANRK